MILLKPSISEMSGVNIGSGTGGTGWSRRATSLSVQRCSSWSLTLSLSLRGTLLERFNVASDARPPSGSDRPSSVGMGRLPGLASDVVRCSQDYTSGTD